MSTSPKSVKSESANDRSAKKFRPTALILLRLFRDPGRIGPYRAQGRLLDPYGTRFAVADRSHRWYLARVIEPFAPWHLHALREDLTKAGRIDSPRILPIAEMDLDAEKPWYVQPYVDGTCADTRTIELGDPSAQETRLIALGVAEALADIHAAGLVHGDLSPFTVFLGPDGPLVTDTGLGPGAEEPLQWTRDPQLPVRVGPDDPVTAASDVFAWGMLLAYMACDEMPYAGDTREEVLRRAAEGRPDLTGLPEDLVEPVRAAIHPDPGQRPTAARLLDRLTGADTNPELDPREVVRVALADHWTGPEHSFVRWGKHERPLERRLEMYGFLLAVVVGIVVSTVSSLTGS